MAPWFFETETECKKCFDSRKYDRISRWPPPGCGRFLLASCQGGTLCLVHRLIDGLASWDNLESVQKIRERYSKSTQNNQNSQSKQEKRQARPCFRYNKRSGCSEHQDHMYKNLLLKHACQLCYEITGLFEKHARFACPRNTQNVSKNA